MVKVIVIAVRAKINVFFFIMLHWFSMIHARPAPDIRYNAGIICTLHDNIAIFWNMRKPSSRHEIYFIARRAFSTAITVTPTSAKTASHIVATPNAAKIRKSSFTPRANAMF